MPKENKKKKRIKKMIVLNSCIEFKCIRYDTITEIKDCRIKPCTGKGVICSFLIMEIKK
jgi:hypothetical protein